MENLPLAPLDIVIFLTLLVGAVRGFTKGLVFSVASLVGLAGGIAAIAFRGGVVFGGTSPGAAHVG